MEFICNKISPDNSSVLSAESSFWMPLLNVVRRSCYGQVLNALVAITVTFVCLVFIASLRCFKKQRCACKQSLPACVRGALSVALLLSLSGELAESMLSHSASPDSPLPTLSAIAALCSLLAWLSGEVLCIKLSRMVILPRFYYATPLFCGTFLASAKTVSVANMFWWSSANANHVRPFLVSASAVLYLLIWTTDISFLCFQQRCNKKCRNSSANDVTYKHESANFYSKATFFWLLPLLRLGHKTPLEVEDLGVIPKTESTVQHFRNMLSIYESLQGSSRVSLWRCYLLFSWRKLTLGGVLKFLGDMVGFIGPLGISVIVTYVVEANKGTLEKSFRSFQDYPYITIKEFFSNGYIMGVLVFISAILQGTFSQGSTHIVNMEGIRIKAALQALVYNKSLKLPIANLSDFEDESLERVSSSYSVRRPTAPLVTCHDIQGRKTSSEKQSQAGLNAGSIINLLSEDTINVMSFIWIGHYIWAIPLKIGVLMYLLHRQLGLSALFGASFCILVMTPLQFLLGKRMSAVSKSTSKASDERLRCIHEILQGVKLLKLYGWEDEFEKRIQQIRNRELCLLKYDSVYWAAMTFLTHASSALVTLATFGAYIFLENAALSPAEVFAALALFNQLTVPLFIFPIAVPIVISAMVSTRRLEEFLALPETDTFRSLAGMKCGESTRSATDDLDSDATQSNPKEVHHFLMTDNICCRLRDITESDEAADDGILPASNETAPNLNDCDCRENEKVDEETRLTDTALCNAETKNMSSISTSFIQLSCTDDISIPKGKMTLIIGPIGSGKTSLLLTLLSEMPAKFHCNSVSWDEETTIAYCSQRPWLQNTTVRENILFGRRMEPRRYARVVAACALQPDLDILPVKDLTEIGEKGISLSGGQKHRVAIARALYSDANTVVLDDPTSALDYQVIQHLVEEGLSKLLLKKRRTVILVTHCLQLLSYSDHVLVVENGEVTVQGSPDEITRQRPEVVRARSQMWSSWRRDSSEPEWKDAPLTPDEGGKEGEIGRGEKTARERWHLVRLVSRIGLQSRHNSNVSSVVSRKQSHSFHGSRHLTHDLPLPVDECASRDADLEGPETWRRSLRRIKHSSGMGSFPDVRLSFRRHREIKRVSSLQPRSVTRASFRGLPAQAWLDCTGDSDLIGNSTTRCNKIDSPPVTLSAKRIWSDTSSQSFSNGEAENATNEMNISIKNLNLDILEKDATDRRRQSNSFSQERQYGEISQNVYIAYMKACGIFVGILYLCSTLAWQSFRFYTDFWLSNWTEYSDKSTLSSPSETGSKSQMLYYLFVYSALSSITIILSLLSNLVGQLAGAHARRTLHQQLASNILRLPIKFFDRTPIGQIINRFSADIAVIDKKLTTSIHRLLHFVLLCFSAILINAALSVWFALAALPICTIYYVIQSFYRSSSRELQRIDSVTRSPILSNFSETLTGLSTIRSFGHQNRFLDIMMADMDVHNNAFFVLNAVNRWLGIALDYLGGVIVLISVVGTLWAAKYNPDIVTPSLVGLAINYTLLVPIYLNWVVKFLADVEMYMGAVERIERYSEIPKEDYNSEGVTVSTAWPRKGDIIFQNVSLRYDDQRDTVVTNLNLMIPTGQKVALCGRTGCGKSSVVMSIFRMLDICEGKIMIDDVDISKLSLRLLRSRLSIIPQDVVMFSGTVRDNLDPLSKYDDESIWRSLCLAQLKDLVEGLPQGIDTVVKEGGENLSLGTRQLFCLARAILHDAALLVMDEATSSLDQPTEQAILTAAMSAFANKTVIVVAHRLHTILGCDRVIVLDEGRIVEDGHPTQLANISEGSFANMLRAAKQL